MLLVQENWAFAFDLLHFFHFASRLPRHFSADSHRIPNAVFLMLTAPGWCLNLIEVRKPMIGEPDKVPCNRFLSHFS